MKTWLSYLLATIIGFTAAFTLGSLPQYDTIVGYATGIILNVGTFVLLPLVFVTLMAAIGSLRKDKGTIGPVFLVSTAWSIFSALVLSILAGLAFQFFPSDFPMASGTQFTTSTSLVASLTQNLMENLSRFDPLANGPFMNLLISPSWLLPVAFTAFIFGFVMKPDQEPIKPAYAVMNSFSEMMYRLSHALAGIGWVFVLFYSAQWFKTFSTANLIEIPNFIILAGGSALAAVLVVIPLLFWVFTGFKGNPYKLLIRSIGPSLLGLFSGNMLLALPGAYHISRRNLGVQKRVDSTTLPFATFFTRGGTAMISTICLCAMLTRANIAILDFRTIAFIAGACTSLSLLCSLNLGYETIFVSCIASSMLGYDLGGVEMLAFAILPIINGLGVFVDMVLSFMQTYVVGRAIGATIPVAYRETI